MSTAALHPADNPNLESKSRATIIVMGVSGSGKTTAGVALGQALDVPFIDGDDLHSDEARAKMAAGTPLTDEDRVPWLNRIGDTLADTATYPQGAIIACSALRHAYRDRLRQHVGPGLRFLFLNGDKSLIRERIAARKGHYMPASLVDSQFATLEVPDHEPDVIAVPADADLASELPGVIDRLRAG
jgi:gluconokinase